MFTNHQLPDHEWDKIWNEMVDDNKYTYVIEFINKQSSFLMLVHKRWNVYLLGSHGKGSVQKYSASSASFADILCQEGFS